MKKQSNWSQLDSDSEWEEKVLEYAINAFPYMDALDFVSDHPIEDHEIVSELIHQELLKVGFYYEKMTEVLTIFYFLNVDGNTYIALGLDGGLRLEIETKNRELFPISEEQYIELCHIKLN